MARVKNQVLFEDEESYTDASGQAHYNGVAYRQGATEAYPGYIGAEYGTVRKSPRSRRPPHQGRGSAAQTPYRECFAACAERWGSLPDVCSEDQFCDPTSSKESVYSAKADAGVSCSAFDLYMRCCMSNCGIIQVSGPGGASYSGGVIPDAESCFKCSDNIPVFSIAAASPVISCGASIGLSIDPAPGAGVSWSIALASGGGALVGDIYTAPATNPDCTYSPTFELTVCDKVVGSFSLAVNCAGSTYIAGYLKPVCRSANNSFGECYCFCGPGNQDEYSWHYLHCDGAITCCSTYYTGVPNSDPHACDDPNFYPACEHGSAPSFLDIRTPELRSLGCCPPIP